MICPICYRSVRTNAGGVMLAVHRDKAGRMCPAAGQLEPMKEEQ